MKRLGNLFERIVDIENLKLADKKARKGKSKQYGVKVHIKNEEINILKLHEDLKSGDYKTSNYNIFIIKEPKERVIYRLPYFPDRIVHHAIMNILEPIFVSMFTADTYSCIKGRGVHKASYKLRVALLKPENIYCLKLDIRKFYPSVDNEILKCFLRRKIKDDKLLNLLDELIDSCMGLPIGNITSQWFGNLYLNQLDHWIKEELKVKHYFRYCDDMVILGDDKQELHRTLEYIRNKPTGLKLEIKDNYQIFPIFSRGIDFLGYKHFKGYTLLRKSIKRAYIRNKIKTNHWGWIKHCNSINLKNKYENN